MFIFWPGLELAKQLFKIEIVFYASIKTPRQRYTDGI
jgi:hypothetical protein